MPCNPSDNNIDVSGGGGISIPGIGIPISPIQFDSPITFPEGFPQVILDLIELLSVNFPGGELIPNLDDFSNNVLKALSDLFSKISPFLSIYNFFMALLNMISCILEVICALPNPFKVIRAVRKLVKKCLLPFLQLFPFLALLAMIIAILLLLIALIEYVIQRLLALLNDLIANITLLVNGLTLQDGDSTAAVIFKISTLICLLENLFAFFQSLRAIFAIIESLAALAGGIPCGNSDSDCCTEDSCPPFLKDTNGEIVGTQGQLIYYKQINANPLIPANSFSRAESWQFINLNSQDPYQFKNIITSYGAGIFWPEGIVYENNSSNYPYSIDLILNNFDPAIFNPSDFGGPRDFIIEKTIIKDKPDQQISTSNNGQNTFNDGVVNLTGGLVYEYDGYTKTPYIISGTQATLNTFFHQTPSSTGQAPITDDGYFISSIPFNWVIKYESLLSYNLTTYGCMPDVAVEFDAAAAIIGDTRSVISKIGRSPIPDLDKFTSCYSTAITNFRKKITIETAQDLQLILVNCLEDFRGDTLDVLCKALDSTVDLFKSNFAVSPEIQFTTRPIDVKVTLINSTNVNSFAKIPEECGVSIASNLKGEATLGSVSEFTYDEAGFFNAKLTSAQPGDGQLKILYKNSYLQNIINQDNIDAQTATQDQVLDYTFIGPASGSGVEDLRDTNRRDPSDNNN